MNKILSIIIMAMCWITTISSQMIYTNVGESLPDFEIVDIQGKTVSNASIIGKPSLIVFFGTRCPPCLKELKLLNEKLPLSYYKTFNVIAVGSTDDAESLERFNNRMKFKFTFLPDPNQDLFDRVGDHTIPRTYLLDRQGKIIRQTLGFNKTPFENLLKKMKALENSI